MGLTVLVRSASLNLYQYYYSPSPFQHTRWLDYLGDLRMTPVYIQLSYQPQAYSVLKKASLCKSSLQLRRSTRNHSLCKLWSPCHTHSKFLSSLHQLEEHHEGHPHKYSRALCIDLKENRIARTFTIVFECNLALNCRRTLTQSASLNIFLLVQTDDFAPHSLTLSTIEHEEKSWQPHLCIVIHKIEALLNDCAMKALCSRPFFATLCWCSLSIKNINYTVVETNRA